MFEDCNSLAELNKARTTAIMLKEDTVMVINTAYQEKRKELVAKAPVYRKINIFRPLVESKTPYMTLPYAGPSDGRSIVYTAQGFKV